MCVRVSCFLFFVLHLHAFLRRPWVFSRALGCGARRGPDCTPRRNFGSRAGSVARTLGVQSREIWLVTTGSLSDQLEPTGPMQNLENAIFSFLTCLCCCFGSTTAPVRQRLGSHGTATVLQAFPFVTTTNGACACRCVCVRVSVSDPTAAGTRQSSLRKQRYRCHSALSLHFSLSLCCLLLLCLYHTVSF